MLAYREKQPPTSDYGSRRLVNGAASHHNPASIDVTFSSQVKNDMKAATCLPLISPHVQQFLNIIIDIDLSQIIDMCIKSQ